MQTFIYFLCTFVFTVHFEIIFVLHKSLERETECSSPLLTQLPPTLASYHSILSKLRERISTILLTSDSARPSGPGSTVVSHQVSLVSTNLWPCLALLSHDRDATQEYWSLGTTFSSGVCLRFAGDRTGVDLSEEYHRAKCPSHQVTVALTDIMSTNDIFNSSAGRSVSLLHLLI